MKKGHSSSTATRREFLGYMSAGTLQLIAMKTSEASIHTGMMPAIFVGHGSPMNVVRDNAFTRTLAETGRKLPAPAAILVISAHWMSFNKTLVSTTAKPGTIYDFGGFQDELYKIVYGAKGAPELAELTRRTVKSVTVLADSERGLDHGAWTVLRHMYPKADIPVFQLSMDMSKPPQYHYDLGRELMTLREKGVLIIGSGNIVHNLGRIDGNEDNGQPEDWAREFDAEVRKNLDAGSHKPLIDYPTLTKEAATAVPTSDHYLPMLYILGLQKKHEKLTYLFEGFQNANLSMRCFSVGRAG